MSLRIFVWSSVCYVLCWICEKMTTNSTSIRRESLPSSKIDTEMFDTMFQRKSVTLKWIFMLHQWYWATRALCTHSIQSGNSTRLHTTKPRQSECDSEHSNTIPIFVEFRISYFRFITSHWFRISPVCIRLLTEVNSQMNEMSNPKVLSLLSDYIVQ